MRTRWSFLPVTRNRSFSDLLRITPDIENGTARSVCWLADSFAVADRFEHGSERHFYRLTVEEPRPDFTVTAADNALVKSADQPISIPITIDRKDGFLVPLDFRVEGLPEGLVSEPTRSEKDGDSAKAVTLKISGATAQGFHGPVKILAAPASGSMAPRAVTSAVPGTLIGTDRIWLTIPGTP